MVPDYVEGSLANLLTVVVEHRDKDILMMRPVGVPVDNLIHRLPVLALEAVKLCEGNNHVVEDWGRVDQARVLEGVEPGFAVDCDSKCHQTFQSAIRLSRAAEQPQDCIEQGHPAGLMQLSQRRSTQEWESVKVLGSSDDSLDEVVADLLIVG